MNRNNLVIGILGIVIAAVGIFAFIQTQNLIELQDTSTQVASNLRNEAIQFAQDAAATATQAANSVMATDTQQADSAIATATQQAENAMGTMTQQAAHSHETATHSALIINAQQLRADATAIQAANSAATQSMQSTETAHNLATEQLELTVAAIVYSEAQSTLQAQSDSALSTLDASGYIGDGIYSEDVTIPEEFQLFVGTGYSIALPATYVGSDIASDEFDELEDALSAFELDDTADALQEREFIFFAIDTTDFNGMPRVTVSLTSEQPIIAEASLTDYMGSAYVGLEGDFAMIASDIVPINGQAAGRVIVDQRLSTGVVRQLQYVFSGSDGNFYVLTFTSPMTEYANIRLDLEASAATLRIEQ